MIDASMVAAWLLPEEFTSEADDIVASISVLALSRHCSGSRSAIFWLSRSDAIESKLVMRGEALNAWIAAAGIDEGSVFRGIGRWGTVSKRAIDPRSINAILKQRAEMAGLAKE